MLCLLIKMLLSIDFARQEFDALPACAFSLRHVMCATRDSGGGQVQSTKLDRAWVLLHFI